MEIHGIIYDTQSNKACEGWMAFKREYVVVSKDAKWPEAAEHPGGQVFIPWHSIGWITETAA